ncbi:hypothetical protein JL722_9800 [Aureococcus anophagefferens]|nr:hypothetical protein JL722_9800 [Aureococcus anophagefferens]
MKHNPLGPVCLILGVLSAVVAAYDLSWFYRYSNGFISAINGHMIKVIFFSACLALSNGMMAMGVSNSTKLLYEDAHDQPAPAPATAREETPRASTLRRPLHVEAQIVGMFFIVLVKSTLQFQGLLFEDESASCPHEGQAGMMLGFVQLFFVICGLSGIIPLVGHLTKLVLPSRQPIVSLRNKMYIFILPWSSAVQTVILFGMILGNIIGECSAKHADQVTLAVEMLIFQIVSHRAFVPMFTWGPHKPPPPFLANGIPDDFQFIVAPDKMAAVYGGAADAKVAQGGAETELPVAADA